MPKLYVTEYAQLAQDSMSRPAVAAQEPALGSADPIVLDITAEAKESRQFISSAKFVRVHADEACHIRVDGPATRSHTKLAAGQTEYFGVPAGKTISVISAE